MSRDYDSEHFASGFNADERAPRPGLPYTITRMLNSIPSTLLGKPIKPNKVYFKDELIPPSELCDKDTPDYEKRLRNMSKYLPPVQGYDNNTLLFGEKSKTDSKEYLSLMGKMVDETYGMEMNPDVVKAVVEDAKKNAKVSDQTSMEKAAEIVAERFVTKINSDIIDDMIEAANKRGEDSHSICYSAKRIGKEERERRRVSMPLGMWDSQGYWRPDIRISMTAEEQYETNKAMGIEMKMRRMSQAEVVEETHKRIDPVQDTIDATNKGLTEAHGSHLRKKREEASYRSMKHEEYLVMRENLKNKYVDIVMAMPDEWVLPPRATELFSEVIKVMDNSYGPKR